MTKKIMCLGGMCFMLTLIGCGQTGKLYLPEKPAPQATQSQ